MPKGLSGVDHFPIARALDLCGFRRAPEAFSNWYMASSTDGISEADVRKTITSSAQATTETGLESRKATFQVIEEGVEA